MRIATCDNEMRGEGKREDAATVGHRVGRTAAHKTEEVRSLPIGKSEDDIP